MTALSAGRNAAVQPGQGAGQGAAGQRPARSWWRRHQAVVAPALMLAPSVLLFLVFVVYPVGQTFWTSLHDWNGLGEMRWIGLGNYEELWRTEKFFTAIRNNVLWLAAFLTAPVWGLFLALFLNQQGRGMRAAKTLFFLPFVISSVVIGVLFTWFYNPSFGLLAKLAGLVGLPAPRLLTDPELATFAVIAAGMWPQIAYCMMLYLTGLTAVDRDLVEAGRIDGARGPRMLWHIIVPQLRAATGIVFVVTVIGALTSFDLVQVMTAGGPFGQTSVLAQLMYQQSLLVMRPGFGSAIAVVLFLIMLAYVLVFLRRTFSLKPGGN